MKIKEVLSEGVTDIVARFYKEAGREFDQVYNREDVKYKDQTREYYKEFFEDWYKDDIVPVFLKPTTKPQKEYDTKPKEGVLQSPGYRGQQYAKARADVPYDKNVQGYEPQASQMLPSHTMDGAINNNGN
jgi:hypothetical protein